MQLEGLVGTPLGVGPDEGRDLLGDDIRGDADDAVCAERRSIVPVRNRFVKQLPPTVSRALSSRSIS